MKIAFVLTYLPNPRMQKRINALRTLGEVTVVCVRRLNQDIYVPSKLEGVVYKIKELVVPPFSLPFKRMMSIGKFRHFIYSSLNEIRPDVIYTSGLDALQVVNAYSKRKNVKVIFEVADLRESFIRGIKKSIFRKVLDALVCALERRCFSCVNLLILTSKEFYNVHYSKFVGRDRLFIFPNVPDLSVFKGFVKKNGGDFTVGFIGALRYLDQMKLLIDATQSLGINVFFAGGGSKENEQWLENYSRNRPWVQVLGRYIYNQDISSLYERADVIYSVYDADNANVRIALPNKLYESVYCSLPIIVAKNTYLARLVEEWGVGASVSHTSIEELQQLLLNLRDNEKLRKEYEQNCLRHRNEMDVSLYDSDLKNRILQITNFK